MVWMKSVPVPRVANLERAGRIVGAMGEELERGGRPLDALHRGARLHPGRQVLEQLKADTCGRVAKCLQRQRWIVRRRYQRRREYARRTVETDIFDAGRQQRV